jgi:hypothetical protein
MPPTISEKKTPGAPDWEQLFEIVRSICSAMYCDQMATRQKRYYIKLLEKGINASEVAIDCYNRVHNPYRTESTLIFATNGWELLAKAILIKNKKSITDRDRTISAEVALHKLYCLNFIDSNQSGCVQQIISLRNAASHDVLPEVPQEITQHLLYFSSKFFRDLVQVHFPTHEKKLRRDYLALSFSDLTTYADKVQKVVSKIKRSESDRQLAWLLDRGIRFDGNSYFSINQFVKQYKKKSKVLPHLGISDFIKTSDMVRLVPVEAPKNFTADIVLRKGKKNDPSLPVIIKKTDVESDYPYLTKELAAKIGKTPNFTSKLINHLKIKGDYKYHQSVRSSATSQVNRYSSSALESLITFLSKHPNFNPYTKK